MNLEEYNEVIRKIVENGEKLSTIESDIQEVKRRISNTLNVSNYYMCHVPTYIRVKLESIYDNIDRESYFDQCLTDLKQKKEVIMKENERLFEKALSMIQSSRESSSKSDIVSKIDTITINLLHIDDIYSEKKGKSNQSLLSLISNMIRFRNEIELM